MVPVLVPTNKQGTLSPGVGGSMAGKNATTPIPTCSACGIVIGDDVKALECDRCHGNDSWKWIDYLNISP